MQLILSKSDYHVQRSRHANTPKSIISHSNENMKGLTIIGSQAMCTLKLKRTTNKRNIQIAARKGKELHKMLQ